MIELHTPRHSVPRPDQDLNPPILDSARGFHWSEFILGIFLGTVLYAWMMDYAESKTNEKTTQEIIHEMENSKK